MFDFNRLTAAYERAKADLLAERTPDGHWVGELSSSALATATAVSALAIVEGRRSKVESRNPEDPTFDLRPSTFDSLIARGVAYLARQQNPDGGFGDTDLSHSNIATTYLVVAALHLAGAADQHSDLLKRANAYIASKGGLDGLRKRYGIDKTFVVPIMTNLALAGLIDWRAIDPLPFELACVPQAWYRFVGMPVVSYAIPALVAIGQARYHHAPPRNPFTRLLRWLSITRSLRVLRRMQPDSGGYLEATPLTAFVVMSLASISQRFVESRKSKVESQDGGNAASTFDIRHSTFDPASEVIREGVKFLVSSIRPDGSWPIDTNLATWNTTLAINALAGAGEDVAELLLPKPRPSVAVPSQPADSADSATTGRGFGVLDWLLSCQHTQRHPFTGAKSGGFGWSDLSGAVPDADDTPGALLTLATWCRSPGCREQERRLATNAAAIALRWLLDLQNADGGWPTFCRGWGRLPFDRSGPDLTAHVVRALLAWHPHGKLSPFPVWGREHLQIDRAIGRATNYLMQHQLSDGSWLPLWFGNQDRPTEDNPVYGTAKVSIAMIDDEPDRGVAWLVANQNADGGWGSGVWRRIQNAECRMQNEGQARNAELGARSGVEGEEPVTESGGASHSVLDTQYLVPGSGQPDAMAAQSAIRNPKSAIAAAPICNLQFAITNLQSSVEETALAVEALLAACPRNATEGVPYSAVARGLAWLIDRVEAGQHRQPAPIGFYFAKLWYYERLYPLTFTVAALGRACRQFAHHQQPDSHADSAPARAP
jgi:squalene-hopene/tetraprenyl-beta-curcumene cyclase